jgi:MFS family permease
MSATASRVLSIFVVLLLSVAVALAWLANPGSALLVAGVATDDPFFIFVFAAYALTTGVEVMLGAVLSVRVPNNPIGRILLALGIWQAATLFASMALVALAPGGPDGEHLRNLGSWLGAWTFVPMITIPGVVVLVLFPTGRPLSPRWRTFVWLAGIGTAAWALSEASRPLLGLTELPNLYVANRRLESLGDALSLMLAGGLVGAGANIILRFRRSRGDERLQLKWITFAGILLIVTWGILWLVSEVAPDRFGGREVAVATFTIALLFAAIAASILKYRLYDIDRLISRTVTYGLAVGVLALVYATVAVALPQLIGWGDQSSLATAAGTLAAAGLFRPLTARLQAVMDRRFNRTRFDAELEVNSFVTDLSQRLNLPQMLDSVIGVVQRTVAPVRLTIWIR